MNARFDKNAASQKGDLTNGRLARHLTRLSVPMVWGIFAIISFQLANMFYISRLGTEYLAAMSFTFPVTFIVHNLSIAMAIATSSVVARQIGEGNWLRVRRLTTHALMAGLLAGILMSIIGIASIDPVFRAMGADEQAIEIIKDYLIIWFSGSMLLTIPMIGNAALRASGDSVFPAAVMTIAALINVILDPILIFGLFGAPALGVKGAAIANVFAYGCTMVAGLYVLRVHKNMIALRFMRLRLFGDSLKRLIFIALPAGLTMTLQPLAGIVLVGMLATYGQEAVAAYGIVTRVEAFAFIPIMALATGMAPIIGQNWGARNFERVEETLRLAILFCFAWSLGVAVLLGIAGPSLAHIFGKGDDQITNIVSLYFWVVLPSLAIGNLLQGWASAFNAMGKPQRSFVMIFIRMIVLTVPLAWTGSELYGLPGLFGGIALANVIAGLGAHLASRRVCRNEQAAALNALAPGA